MGRSHSKEQPDTGNNPWEAEIARRKRRERSAKEAAEAERRNRKRTEKEAKRARKVAASSAAATARRKSRLEELREPEPPPIVRKTRAKLEGSDYDAEAKRRMQHQLAFGSDTFVLNQLLLGVQFYGNYEREMWEAVERNRSEENRRNSKLSNHCKTVLLPDRLLEAIDLRIKFCAKHGPQKNQLQPLHTQTCYVVHDNVEITNPGDSSVYSILTDAPIYKLELEDSLDNRRMVGSGGGGGGKRRRGHQHHGYVKLKSVELIKPRNSPPTMDPLYGGESSGLNKRRPVNGKATSSPSDSDTLEDEDEEDDNGSREDDDDEEEVPIRNFGKIKFRDSVVAAKHPKRNNDVYGAGKKMAAVTNGVPSTSTSSTSPPSSEYDYAYITAINTHQPLSVMRSAGDESLSTTILPDYCVTTINCPIELNEGYYSDNESDMDKLTYLSKAGAVPGKVSGVEYVTEQRQYLNSKGFLAYFINLFQDQLSEELSIGKEELASATWKGAAVYSGQWEIVPAILSPWPREAIEWIHRKREVKINPVTRQKFQWPTPPMIQKVKSFGCHVIPTGYAPKQGQNRYRQLEWKIVFPEAERYLESCLSNTQTKIYVLTKLLLKTFVEPASLTAGMSMFGNEHLRAHLFWQCETNYAAWPEDYLGEALVRFLNALLDRIKTHNLPDYFLPDRNLFENVPEKVLVELHKRIFRITENPVMHMLIALRNLKLPSTRPAFYPKVRIKRLYSLLVIDNPLKIVNPQLRDSDENLAAEDSDENAENEKEIAVGSMAYYNQQEIESRRKRTRIVRFMVAERLKKDQAKEPVRRTSVESIDLTFTPLKHMENLRRQLIYGVFIDHFLEMAKVSHQFSSTNQSLIYLRQAERLCDLLADDQGIEEAKKFLTAIYTLRSELAKASASTGNRPALPKRVSMASNSRQQQQQQQQQPQQRQRQQQRQRGGRAANKAPNSYSNVQSPRSSRPKRLAPQQPYLPTNGEERDSQDDEDAADRRIEVQRRRSQRQTRAQVHPQTQRSGQPPVPPATDDTEDISWLLGNVSMSERR